MNPPSDNPENDRLRVHRCLEGDPDALAGLRERHHESLVRILRARGADAGETEELLADLWGDCVPTDAERPSLLEKFSGKCPLQGWLATVATRRWIDLKRKQSRRGAASPVAGDDSRRDPFESLPAPAVSGRDDVLIELLRESLQAAFAACAPADMLMLRLVYLHGVAQREIMRMWNWSESKVSRQLSHAMEQIEQTTLQALKRKDPWLDLTWQDFVHLCETHRIGFL